MTWLSRATNHSAWEAYDLEDTTEKGHRKSANAEMAKKSKDVRLTSLLPIASTAPSQVIAFKSLTSHSIHQDYS
jgi:hypothetical protein